MAKKIKYRFHISKGTDLKNIFISRGKILQIFENDSTIEVHIEVEKNEDAVKAQSELGGWFLTKVD